MPDRLFSSPELARLYDPFDPDRSDLDAYVDLLEELGARSVLDVGCGTGTLALRLASRGFEVVGVDPAEASLEVAKSKPGAAQVTWIHGDALISSSVTAVDAVTMTGNVAQVFLTDDDWLATLRACSRALRSGGYLVFEARDPSARAWERWTRDDTFRTLDVEGLGEVSCWEEITRTEWPLVTFETTFVLPGKAVRMSTSTLRFRSREELLDSVRMAQFDAVEVRDAPDRPGLELVVIARRRAHR